MPTFLDTWLIPVISIFFIVDPLAAIPSFLTMTAGDPPEKRRAMALKASVASTIILIVFATAGATVMVLMRPTSSWGSAVPVYAAIVLTGIATFILLTYSAVLQRALGKTGIHVLSRLMGLVLATMAVQFILDGLREGGYVTRPPAGGV